MNTSGTYSYPADLPADAVGDTIASIPGITAVFRVSRAEEGGGIWLECSQGYLSVVPNGNYSGLGYVAEASDSNLWTVEDGEYLCSSGNYAEYYSRYSDFTVYSSKYNEPGYRTESVTVTDKNDKAVAVTDHQDGTYSFIMPASGVTVEPVFVRKDEHTDRSCLRDETCPMTPFTDTDRQAWYHDGVHWVIENGIMHGTDENTFGPLTVTSRAMSVTTLWRMEGSPETDSSVTFEDVPEGMWYTDAVRWAAVNGIVTGYSAEEFCPADPVTREQLATILYRYVQQKGQGFAGTWAFPLNFSDADQVSGYAYEALCWMTMQGIVEGMDDHRLAPQEGTDRAQLATILMRFDRWMM